MIVVFENGRVRRKKPKQVTANDVHEPFLRGETEGSQGAKKPISLVLTDEVSVELFGGDRTPDQTRARDPVATESVLLSPNVLW